MKKISIVVPCFNEEENVQAMHDELQRLFMKQLNEYDYEIIFIDNNSADKTRSIIENMCKIDLKTKAIFNAKNFGQFNSPYYGLLQSTGDCSILMAADFQDPVDMIPKYVKSWEEGYKIVIGRKTSSKENKLMYFLRSLYYKMIQKMSDVEQIEHFTGFGLYDSSFIETLRNLHDPTPFLRGIVAELGSEIKIIDFDQPLRRAGNTHNNWYSLYDAAMLSFTSYTKVGLRIATFGGFIVGGISVLVAVVYFVLKLIYWDRFDAGTAPIIIGIFFMGGMQLFFIGLVGEYIMNMNSRIMNRPLVVEDKRINFKNKGADKNDA